MYDQILVRFGDLTLKGKNQKEFLHRLYALVDRKMADLKVKIEKTYDRIYIHLNGESVDTVLKRLDYVSGISSYSLVAKCDNELETIKKTALDLMKELVQEETSFKVETKRANKQYPLTSLAISKEVSAYVLSKHKFLKVDVHHPKLTLHLEVKGGFCYLYNQEIKALGGYPVGVAGKGMLLLSGGIDSPVAGFLAMKQGVEIECIHFESTPLTSIESAQKVVDLVKKLARYAPLDRIVLHMVPFKELHMALLEHIPESYNITIMRRMMYRIAEKLSLKRHCLCLINGESVGQVASQTLQSMNTINSVTNFPILRPLCTYDKTDIIRLSRKIDCYDLSIRPFEDCCTVYVPKAPATAPKLWKAEAYEQAFDYETLVDEAVSHVQSLVIDQNSDLDLTMFGLEVREVLKEIQKK